MKKVISILFLVLALVSGPIQAQDSWTGSDKNKHFAVSLALGGLASSVTDSKPKAFMLAMAPGIAKELYDMKQTGNRFSYKDVVWDAVGAYAGITTGFYIKKNGVYLEYTTQF